MNIKSSEEWNAETLNFSCEIDLQFYYVLDLILHSEEGFV